GIRDRNVTGVQTCALPISTYRRVMSAVLNAAIDEGLAMSHDDYRSALVRRAALAELALDLFEDCDALASLPAPGAAPERLDVTRSEERRVGKEWRGRWARA